MPQSFSIPIDKVVDLLGLTRKDPPTRGASSIWVKCPFCEDPGYHMNVDLLKNNYRCVLCSGSEKGLGALDLYGRVAHGVRCETGPGGNSKKLYAQLCKDLDLGKPASVMGAPRKAPVVRGIPKAADEVLNETYSRLLSLPQFALSKEHRNNLLERGLSQETIVRNEYRTVDMKKLRNGTPAEYQMMFMRENLSAEKAKHSRLKNISNDDLMVGLMIADILRRLGCVMSGVPGFFRLRGRWCFLISSGMIIPTRNVKGEIVGLQIRLDSGKKLRYMTVSAKGLPGGVTTGISRTHFPLGNGKIGPDTILLLTEGPLKADVALDLLPKDKNYALMAIQGVNNTSELRELFPYLKQRGVTAINNALDMDRLLKRPVMKASRDIRKLAGDSNLQTRQVFWDYDFAKAKAKELSLLCREHEIPTPKSGDAFVRIGVMANALGDGGVDFDPKWSETTKGIDDYLKIRKKTLPNTSFRSSP